MTAVAGAVVSSDSVGGDVSAARSVGQLLAFATIMFLGSYVSGSIPLHMPLSEEKLQLVSVLGAGLLVGTALAVIIPEGVQALLSGAGEAPDHEALAGLDRSIGLALVLGFLCMLLIDQLASRASSKSDLEANSSAHSSAHGRNVSWITTLGLVVHAAADGIALGAAVSTRHADIEFIVFLAIMLHKAPAAFGLTSFLMREGLDKLRIRRHLLTFSLSAPLMAILTYLSLVASGHGRPLDTMFATGWAMLFSAGTFLFVATVHVLPEVMSQSGAPGGGAGGHAHGSAGFGRCELLMLGLGIVLPLFMTVGHHH